MMEKLLSTLFIVVCTLPGIWGMVNTDPLAESIDREAFMEQYSLDKADVIRYFNEINTANDTGNGVQLVGTEFVPVFRRHCDDGPIKVIHQLQPNMFISPVPFKYTCRGLYCKDLECLPRKKTDVCQWGVSYTIRQTEGKFLVSEPQIRRVCYETQLQCGCKTCEDFETPKECKSISPCPNLQFASTLRTNCYWVYPTFEKKGKCSCCRKSCIHPLVLNRNMCKCECGLTERCPSPKIIDPDTCECRCPDGSQEDTTTGNCIGNCERFHRSRYCKEIFCVTNPTQQCTLAKNRKCKCPISSCDEISDPGECNRTVCPGTDYSPPIMCKFSKRRGCHCDNNTNDDGCCIKKPTALSGTDCNTYNTIGSRECNANRGCQWVCLCKNITDRNVCAKSTCLAQPNLACVFNRTTGCSCQSCCQDHPDKSNDFYCATLHTAGTLKCNKAKDGHTCQWRCPCSDIDNKSTCLLSTCANDEDRKCTYINNRCFC